MSYGGALNRDLVPCKDPNAAAIAIRHFNFDAVINVVQNEK
jgi:hypothetical protein